MRQLLGKGIVYTHTRYAGRHAHEAAPKAMVIAQAWPRPPILIALLLLALTADPAEEELQGRALGVEIASASIKPIAVTVGGEGENGRRFSGR